MNSTKQLCLNGKYYLEDTPLLNASNRAFRYGDSLFETIHANATSIQFLKEHFGRLTRGMKAIGMEAPVDFTAEKIEMETIRLLNKNKLFGGARIRLTVFRNDGGLYTPTDNSISYVIESDALPHGEYELNRKGLNIGIFSNIKKPFNPLSRFKTGNALPFILAGIERKKQQWDDCLILNDRGNLVEGLSSNLFIVKDGILFTPSLESGCVAGIMREQVIEAALQLPITVFDDCELTPQQLLEADEIFLTNSISGIRWVVAYRHRRYFNKVAKQLSGEINQRAFSK
ncbi:MAG: aminotransferase class IV [Marinifilaceae bacterium]